MKRCISLLLALVSFALFTNAKVEEWDLTVDAFAEASIKASIWSNRANELRDSTNDSDSKFFLDEINGALLDASYLIMIAMEDENLLQDRVEELEPRENMYQRLDESSISETGYIKATDSIYHVSTYWNDHYYSVNIEYYDDEGKLWIIKTVNAAERENGDVLFYLNIFDNAYFISNRCIVLCDQNGENALSIRSLGNTERTVINVEQWQSGVDYEWGEWLLYSID